jgi:hypothetical protein
MAILEVVSSILPLKEISKSTRHRLPRDTQMFPEVKAWKKPSLSRAGLHPDGNLISTFEDTSSFSFSEANVRISFRSSKVFEHMLSPNNAKPGSCSNRHPFIWQAGKIMKTWTNFPTF